MRVYRSLFWVHCYLTFLLLGCRDGERTDQIDGGHKTGKGCKHFGGIKIQTNPSKLGNCITDHKMKSSKDKYRVLNIGRKTKCIHAEYRG